MRGLTRLDQELVYVPLGGLAAGLFATINATHRPHVDALFVFVTLMLILLVVLLGLRRNHLRHVELYDYRKRLVALLSLPALSERPELARGRQIYGLLFAVAWILGTITLTSALGSSS